MTYHATAIAFGVRAVLLRGPSGAGKSDLALRLLALPRDALRAFEVADLGHIALIADDRVQLVRQGEHLLASAPPALRGHIEVRGLGIISDVPVVGSAAVALVVDLVDQYVVERMPEPSTAELLGTRIPRIQLAAFEASTPLKIALALAKGLPAP